MAKEKMGGSKCRQRGGRKDQRGLNARRKAGLPAKAGKRKVYGPRVEGKDGIIVSGVRKAKSFEPLKHAFMMTHEIRGDEVDEHGKPRCRQIRARQFKGDSVFA